MPDNIKEMVEVLLSQHEEHGIAIARDDTGRWWSLMPDPLSGEMSVFWSADGNRS